MRLMSLKQYMKMSKPALIRKITNTIRKMPKKRLAVLCYNITKSKLPRLRKTKRKEVEYDYENPFWSKKLGAYDYPRLTKKYIRSALPKPKTKRKFSRKQLAAQRLFAKRAKAGTLKRRRR